MKKAFLLALLLLTASCTGIKNEKVTAENLKGLVDKALAGNELSIEEKAALQAGVNKLLNPTIQIDSSSGYTTVRVNNEMRQKNLSGKTIKDLIDIGRDEMSRSRVTP